MSVTLADIPEHHRPQKSCANCPFAGPKVGSKGNPKGKIVFVAESPGYGEVRERAPLVGPSGRIFHEFVPQAEPDGDILILNAMECCPPTKLKDPKKMVAATAACHDRLIAKIKEHPRRVIIGMGNPAVHSLTKNFGLKITQARGRLIESDLAEMGIMPVVHISALMKGTGSFRQWKQDIQYGLDIGYGADPKEHIPGNVQFVPRGRNDSENRRAVIHIMSALTARSPKLTGDIETSGLDFTKDRILSFGITPEHDRSISYCFWPEHLRFLKQYLEDRDIEWAWHNGKFDVKFFHKLGIEARVDSDTMLMSYALDENGGVHDLETVAKDVLGAPDYKHMVEPYLPNKKASYELIPEPVLGEYQAIDTCNTAQIRNIYRRRVKRDPALEKLYTRTLIPASEFLAHVEWNGMYIDQERLEENDGYYSELKEKYRLEVCEHAGRDVNPNSSQQMKVLLFDEMKFSTRGNKKKSTGKDYLEKLYDETDHPILRSTLAFRAASKSYGTYVKGVRKHIDYTGRIHSTYKIHGTRTGRLSSSEPNLQNIPRDPQVRGMVAAPPGTEIIEVDLSQAELRSLAAVSRDPILCDIYNQGEDLHSDLAEELFPGWSILKDKELKKEQRVKCKNVNFGTVYGISGKGLRDQTGLPLDECDRMLDGWYNRYKIAGKFIGKCRGTVTKQQVMTTMFGRKKRVGVVSRQNLKHLQNEAANFPHQSIASDITLHTGIKVWRTLDSWGVKIINLVHDSLIMEVPLIEGLRERVITYVREEMEATPTEWGLTIVPFVADAEYGERWGSLINPDEIEEAA